jgi:hypothetical protein
MKNVRLHLGTTPRNEPNFKVLTAENAKNAEKMKMDFRLRGNDKMGNTAASATVAVKM